MGHSSFAEKEEPLVVGLELGLGSSGLGLGLGGWGWLELAFRWGWGWVTLECGVSISLPLTALDFQRVRNNAFSIKPQGNVFQSRIFEPRNRRIAETGQIASKNRMETQRL